MASALPSYNSFSSPSHDDGEPGYANENTTMLECRVCNDVYSLQGDRVPRLLHCGHTVCHSCLTQIPITGSTLLCPFDRQPSVLTDSGVWCLKKNFALLELQEKIANSRTDHNQNSHHYMDISDIDRETEMSMTKCDEDETHLAVIYCTVCCTHLCFSCSQSTHSTRTLARHKRVPLSEKPKQVSKCATHPMHLVEFVCLEEPCRDNPFMCYICKDYGRHARHQHALLDMEAATVRATILSALQHCILPQHALLDMEAATVRATILSALQQTKLFGTEVADFSRRLSTVITDIEGTMSFAQAPDGTTVMQQVPGTANQARTRVRQYFANLHENLDRQEASAITTVDTHIRERLLTLRQEQEDLSLLMSQISSVCGECERTLLRQDDIKLLIAKREVNSLLETIAKQQQQFADVPEQMPLDTAIPITFTKDNRVHIGAKMEMRVVILGLDGSGKTSILFKLKQNEFVQTIPTIGFNVETIEYKNLQFTIWDVGGQQKLRPLWKHYYHNTQAVIFVIDSSCRHRLQEAYHELNKLLQEKDLRDASLLVLANKQDTAIALTIDDLTQQLNLFKLCCNRSWHIQATNAKSGSGLKEGLEWLSCQMVAAM